MAHQKRECDVILDHFVLINSMSVSANIYKPIENNNSNNNGISSYNVCLTLVHSSTIMLFRWHLLAFAADKIAKYLGIFDFVAHFIKVWM